MKGITLQILVISIVAVAGVFAVYLQTPITLQSAIPLKETSPELLPNIPSPQPTLQKVPHVEHPVLSSAKPPIPEVPGTPPPILQITPMPPVSIPAQFPLFTVPVELGKPLRIGIFGESRGDRDAGQPFNFVVLSRILESLKQHQAQAIFFTGNLVSPLKEAGATDSVEAYTKGLMHELQEFSSLYKRIVGNSIPFFPALGSLERRVPKAAELFSNQFHLKSALIIDKELVYAVAIGPALFVVISTGKIVQPPKKSVPEHHAEVLAWLKSTLANVRKEYKYLFVVGHEPAYSDSLIFAQHDLSQRDAFWKILVDNHVFAYFASKEHYFDLSNRSGVWQIISGGGGASYLRSRDRQPFFHSLLLVISPEKGKNPIIQVLDANGNIVEEYELKERDAPVYELRIS